MVRSACSTISFTQTSAARKILLKRSQARSIILSGDVSVDYEQAIVEFGGAYEVWSGRDPGISWLRSVSIFWRAVATGTRRWMLLPSSIFRICLRPL